MVLDLLAGIKPISYLVKDLKLTTQGGWTSMYTSDKLECKILGIKVKASWHD